MKLTSLGRKYTKGKVLLHFVYDNVNQYARVWHPALGTESALESGTAGYVIVMRDVDPKVMDGREYERRRSETKKEDMSWQRIRDDIDFEHLENVSAGRILRILLDNIPSLSQRHSGYVRKFFNEKCAKTPLPVRKTEYYPMECSSFDEATTSGNRDVVHDYLQRQCGLTEEEIERQMIGFSGDQLTIARLRTLHHQTSSSSS